MKERLHNGIELPDEWPPDYEVSEEDDPMPVPYLREPPSVIPIDVGRQLFVDDFLIERTSLRRAFHRPQKYEGNPVLEPKTGLEMNDGLCPVATPFSGGVFFDPQDEYFKMWYHAGWFDGTALATSTDGIEWERPQLDDHDGSNRVLEPRPDHRRDGVSVWLDRTSPDPDRRFKLFEYARSDWRRETGGRLYTSPDGESWTEQGMAGPGGDNTTFYYDPFHDRWVFSIRSYRQGRTRDFVSDVEFLDAGSWTEDEPVYWVATDWEDPQDLVVQQAPQLYKLDAVAYESLMLGLFTVHTGPPNDECRARCTPKRTDLVVGYSRDGFHWYRPDRTPFIEASRRDGAWDRGYLHSTGGVCTVVEDKLYFYYGGWSGSSPRLGSDMYAGGSTGLARLRRDGFASMVADEEEGTLLTRPVRFSGKYLFVNCDATDGGLRVEVVDQDDETVEGHAVEDCESIHADSTRQLVSWADADRLTAGQSEPVRFRFHLSNGDLYSFWVSESRDGESNGYVAAGGPGFDGATDA